MLRVVLYGKFVDLAGESDFTLAMPGHELAVAKVIELIGQTRPALSEQLKKKSTRIVVNDVLDADDVCLKDGDEIAFLPPVSGG